MEEEVSLGPKLEEEVLLALMLEEEVEVWYDPVAFFHYL